MSVVTKRCMSCIYYRTNSTGHSVLPTCDYILIEGHRRGCPAGDECNKYVPSVKTKSRGMIRLPVEEAIVFEMYEHGMTDTEIGKDLGVSAKAIADWRKRRDLPSQHSIRRAVMDAD